MHAVRRLVRVRGRRCDRHRYTAAPGHAEARLPHRLLLRAPRLRGLARNGDPALDRDDRVWRRDKHVDRTALHGGDYPRHPLRLGPDGRRRVPCPPAWLGGTERFTWAELVDALKSSILALVAPILIVGGIRSGAFTATEAGGIGVAYALLVGLLVTRTMSLADIWDELKRAAEISGAILLVIATASLFGWILAAERTPQLVGQWMVSITDSRGVVLLLLMGLLLILGTFMETIAIILILAPIFSALFARYGIDPVHFGLLLTLNLAIGANTPPLGIDLMAACRVAGVPMSDSFRYLGPFLLAMIAVMLLVLFVPALATWLPRASF